MHLRNAPTVADPTLSGASERARRESMGEVLVGFMALASFVGVLLAWPYFIEGLLRSRGDRR